MTDPVLRKARLLRVGAAFVADTATVTARVTLGAEANIWYGVAIRGDDAPISLGARTNVQDNAVVHVDPDAPNAIGADVDDRPQCDLPRRAHRRLRADRHGRHPALRLRDRRRCGGGGGHARPGGHRGRAVLRGRGQPDAGGQGPSIPRCAGPRRSSTRRGTSAAPRNTRGRRLGRRRPGVAGGTHWAAHTPIGEKPRRARARARVRARGEEGAPDECACVMPGPTGACRPLQTGEGDRRPLPLLHRDPTRNLVLEFKA